MERLSFFVSAREKFPLLPSVTKPPYMSMTCLQIVAKAKSDSPWLIRLRPSLGGAGYIVRPIDQLYV